jgi:hypothetical protein
MNEPQESKAPLAGLARTIELRSGQADPEATMVIEHREALIYPLCEAAELEHSIMSSTCSPRSRSNSAQTRG